MTLTRHPADGFPPVPGLVHGPAGPWSQLLRDLDSSGVGLVHASLAEWRTQLPPEPRRQELLGRDWPRYSRLGNDQLRERFMATRMLIRHTAAVALGTEPYSLELRYGLNGRVHLRGYDQIDVSLSHTADLLLCGITSLGVIGIDAEPSERRLSGQDVELFMCTEPERLRLSRTPPEERNALLLRLWTLKEAYSKALGQGLRFPFTQFGFRLADGTARLERADGRLVEDTSWRFATCDVPGGHTAAVALQDDRASTRPDTRAGTALNRQILAAIEGARLARPGPPRL
ncbi:4'-phosphopantetheinyl transferase superfamily protein [Streptomyces sp. NBC_01218]|uniref:4'-phosphopantetheinyl transferase family protein n=1 Tax=unclassified Streptomyces TaxID=2593676 RepID=UPI0023B9A295|nr:MULTISPECIES: 4'-phosphopantetheinyl transferase superfamily protein [unclassified Streptomyces]WEH39062.1 4'-phosphopantetheinyl transferase superfamily protein [Streptomyces sp. AM 2-1-1]WSQ50718.1 4'-phosphopantetheinyl transferase superfamily protein [Streptomyces sp. NBC_01218]